MQKRQKSSKKLNKTLVFDEKSCYNLYIINKIYIKITTIKEMLSMNLAQVTQLQDDNIYEYYENYLSGFSDNTAKNYRVDIEQFFSQMFDKEAKYVSVSDLEGLKKLDIARYINFMGSKYAVTSVKRKLNSVKGFVNYIAGDYDSINKNMFENVKTPKATEKQKSWDSLDWEEAVAIWTYAEDNFGSEIAMLFKLATVTSIRLSALLSSTWSENWGVKSENGHDIHYIEVFDKGSENKKSVSTEFYQELESKLSRQDKLFPNLYPNKVGNILKDCVAGVGIDPKRNIVFHSFKKAGVMRALDQTGSMYKAKEQGNHKSIVTSEKYYLKYKECLTDMPSYSMDKELDMKQSFEGYSKEELLDAIDKMSDSSKFELLRIMQG